MQTHLWSTDKETAQKVHAAWKKTRKTIHMQEKFNEMFNEIAGILKQLLYPNGSAWGFVFVPNQTFAAVVRSRAITLTQLDKCGVNLADDGACLLTKTIFSLF